MTMIDTSTGQPVQQANTVNVSLSLDPATVDAAEVRAHTDPREFAIVDFAGIALCIHEDTDPMDVANAFDRLAHRIRTAILDASEAAKGAAA